MKLRFNRQEAAEALRTISSVAASRTPQQVLKCARFNAQSDVLLLSATDQELSLELAVTLVEVDETGEVLANAETVARIVGECTDETMSLEMVKSQLHLRGASNHFQVVTQDVAEFPAIPALDEKADFTIEYGRLHRLVEWTVFASARESTRYAINGVLWEVEDGKLTLAATDGRRLSVARGELTGMNVESVPQVIVPSKALQLFMRLGVNADAPVSVKVASNQLQISVAGARLSTTLVEGHFPKYRDVIPSDCTSVAEMSTSDFQVALKQAALLTNEESKGVRLAVDDNTITLSSRAPEQGEATVSFPVRYKGEPLSIGFNPVFLLDVLRVAHSDEITMAFKQSDRPGVIKLGEDLVYVVMPVNLASG